MKNSIFQLEKTLELSFSYNENTKQKILNNKFNNFKQNIYKIFEISNEDLITFLIPKELNISIEEFYDKDTFNKFYVEIMKIEDKELLENSIFQLEKTLGLSFSYKNNKKQKILDKNFNNFKKNIYKLFDIPNDDLIIFQIPADLKISIDEFYDN